MAVFELTTGDKGTLTPSQQDLMLRVIEVTESASGWAVSQLRGGARKPGAAPGGWKRESISACSLVEQGLAEWCSKRGVTHSTRDEMQSTRGPRYILPTLEGYWLGDALRIKQRIDALRIKQHATAP